jgi:hypothetical protein
MRGEEVNVLPNGGHYTERLGVKMAWLMERHPPIYETFIVMNVKPVNDHYYETL